MRTHSLLDVGEGQGLPLLLRLQGQELWPPFGLWLLSLLLPLLQLLLPLLFLQELLMLLPLPLLLLKLPLLLPLLFSLPLLLQP